MSKKDKIIFVILGLVSFFLVDTCIVNAEAFSDYWGYDLSHLQRGQFYDCRDSSSCSTAVTTIGEWGYNQDMTEAYPGFYSNSLTVVAGSYGAIFRSMFSETMFLTNHLYNMSLYVCYNSSYNIELVNFYTGGATDIINLTYPSKVNSTNFYSVNNIPYAYIGNSDTADSGDMFTKCGVLVSLFTPAKAGYWFGVQFTGATTFSSRFFVVGYKFTDTGATNGLTSAQVQKVIDNSNLATANDIEEVNSSLEKVSKDINELNETQKETNEKLDDVNSSIKDTQDTIKDSNVDDSTSTAGGFFNDFTTDMHGLTSIITAPLNLISSLTSSSCTPLSLQIPFLESNNTLNLPCMSSIYNEYFGSFLTVYQTITFGLIAYWVCVRFFAMVKDFKNPDKDEIEVMDL